MHFSMLNCSGLEYLMIQSALWVMAWKPERKTDLGYLFTVEDVLETAKTTNTSIPGLNRELVEKCFQDNPTFFTKIGDAVYLVMDDGDPNSTMLAKAMTIMCEMVTGEND